MYVKYKRSITYTCLGEAATAGSWRAFPVAQRENITYRVNPGGQARSVGEGQGGGGGGDERV